MNHDMIAMLRTLTEHVEHHGLADSIVSVRISFGEVDVTTKDRELGMAATLRRWADLLGEITLTAQPSSGGYDYVHVKLAGHLGDYPTNVTWVASDDEAIQLRRFLGLVERPTFTLDLDTLSGLDTAAAA